MKFINFERKKKVLNFQKSRNFFLDVIMLDLQIF